MCVYIVQYWIFLFVSLSASAPKIEYWSGSGICVRDSCCAYMYSSFSYALYLRVVFLSSTNQIKIPVTVVLKQFVLSGS